MKSIFLVEFLTIKGTNYLSVFYYKTYEDAYAFAKSSLVDYFWYKDFKILEYAPTSTK